MGKKSSEPSSTSSRGRRGRGAGRGRGRGGSKRTERVLSSDVRPDSAVDEVEDDPEESNPDSSEGRSFSISWIFR